MILPQLQFLWEKLRFKTSQASWDFLSRSESSLLTPTTRSWLPLPLTSTRLDTATTWKIEVNSTTVISLLTDRIQDPSNLLSSCCTEMRATTKPSGFTMMTVRELTGISPFGNQVYLRKWMKNASLLDTMQSAATRLQQQWTDTALKLKMSEESLLDQDPWQEDGPTLALEVIMMVLCTIPTVHKASLPWVLSVAIATVLIQTCSQTSDASLRTSLFKRHWAASSGRTVAVVPKKPPKSIPSMALNTGGTKTTYQSTDSSLCQSLVEEARQPWKTPRTTSKVPNIVAWLLEHKLVIGMAWFIKPWT